MAINYMSEPIWRCTWCCQDTKTKVCERCGHDHAVSDRTKPHRPEWSRKNMLEAECKICDRVVPMELHGYDNWCGPEGTEPKDKPSNMLDARGVNYSHE